ncbi:hypothetical protein DH2020_035037 [Rehmannia glutinosa]|uniref:Carbohydrate kinase PfkB domain-containing protein n=1 Tax=Rehmannia glutinosa TaxID=99300 RepID=A0ABR0V9H0_REHGL
MGVEIQRKIKKENAMTDVVAAAAPVILGLQPSALVDHVARVDCSLLSRIPGEPGGSFPVAAEELKFVLRSLFIDNLSSYKVDLSRLRLKNGHTAQCVCLVDDLGNRTMRPCLASAVKVQWLVLRYSIFNIEVIQAAIKIAKQEGVSVSLDLASFEMVRKFRLPLLQLLESGSIDLCFANEDEASELLSGEDNADPESALEFLAKHCRWAVVTLGSKGCIAKHGEEIARVPAIGESKAVDATGAGDLFASGFLYGLVKGLSLEECCKIGSCSGGSVIRSLGGEVTPENWQWMYKQMQTKGLSVPDHGNLYSCQS